MRCPLLAGLIALLAALVVSLNTTAVWAATGGPDAFGYTFFDQDDGAVYNYVDITGTGVVVVSGDGESDVITMGAPFSVYGVDVIQMSASTNGFLSNDPGATDYTNDCPLPAVPDLGGGFRVNALNDDLIGTVYYRYLDTSMAATAGFPDQLEGVSVFQWIGTHSGSPGPVDAEIVLFHDTDEILVMIAADPETGAQSTMGIQNEAGNIGLTYDCNSTGYVTPGFTAVRFQAPALPPPTVSINEIRIQQSMADDDEYFELSGASGTLLGGLTYLVIGDGDEGDGTIEAAISLAGQTIPSSGRFVVAESSFTLGVADMTTSLSFENNDTVTHMLVSGFTGDVNDDIDMDDDGLVDALPWSSVLDAVAVIDPSMTSEHPYGPGSGTCTPGPNCQSVTGTTTPAHVFRCLDTTGAFSVGPLDLATVPLPDSPGTVNPCLCGDGVTADSLEACDDMGESATCDTDCTLAVCGDGTVNMTALEICDDSGESVTCDDDCTDATCGDGNVNTTAGELCDDMGESAACDDDCTAALCGDGTTNAAAGEDCDDMGESATCDDDCSLAICGDGALNPTAGETCDDGGRSLTCDDDCTAVGCGDGVVNATAGEQCDGDGLGTAGETVDCDDDCTLAICGDRVINATAGEECDAGAESATCDDDCTAAECGDGVLNVTAGEQCDDTNNEDGDGCSADCLEEEGSEESSSGDTAGLDSSGGGASGGETSAGAVTTMTTDSSGSDSSQSGAIDSDLPLDDGCLCAADPERGVPWGALVLFGLGATRRRRRTRAARARAAS